MGGNQSKEKTEEQIRKDMKNRWDNFGQSKEFQSKQQEGKDKGQNNDEKKKKKLMIRMKK